MERKRLMQFIFALFIAVIFVTSYAAFDNFGGAQNAAANKSQQAPPTVYAAGLANATLTNYTQSLNITVLCKNGSANLTGRINNLLGVLETNGSVASYVPFGDNDTVLDGNANTLSLYDYISSRTNTTALPCVYYNTGGVVYLPASIKLSVEGQSATLQLGNKRTYVVPVRLTSNLSATLKVRVAALLTANGSVYGNLSVTKA
jgi:hypothetical protein